MEASLMDYFELRETSALQEEPAFASVAEDSASYTASNQTESDDAAEDAKPPGNVKTE